MGEIGVNPKERDRWNSRPMEVKQYTLCEGGCDQLKADTEKRVQEVYASHRYRWLLVEAKGCCADCFETKIEAARQSKDEVQSVDP